MFHRIFSNIKANLSPKQPLFLRRLRRPAVFGTLRRTSPLSDSWGFDRGSPIDRYYIEPFLKEYQPHICVRVLEVKDSSYTKRFGTDISCKDVLDVDASNSSATFVADLAAANVFPSDCFDVFILTQTLQYIYDIKAAIIHAHRILKPGGTLLVTMPSIGRIAARYGLQSDLWRFTPASCRRLFVEVFGEDRITVRSYGSVLTAVAFLEGVASAELSMVELEALDPISLLSLLFAPSNRPPDHLVGDGCPTEFNNLFVRDRCDRYHWHGHVVFLAHGAPFRRSGIRNEPRRNIRR